MISHRLILKHEHLGPNIMQNILTTARELLEGKCNETDGYVLEVLKIHRVLDNFISNVNGDCVFHAEFCARTFLPRVGMTCDAAVYLIVPSGVVVLLENIQKMLIMPTALNGYAIEHDRLVRGAELLKKGDRVQVQIDGVKFNKNSFSVFGKMI